MSEQLKGTVALVTGASSGIGEATAEALADAGAAVAIAARRKDRLEALAERIGAKGGEAKALVLEADVTDETTGERCGRSHRGRARASRHPDQQRRGDAARPDRRRAGRGVAADDRAQPARPPVLHARRTAPLCFEPPNPNPVGSPTWST